MVNQSEISWVGLKSTNQRWELYCVNQSEISIIPDTSDLLRPWVLLLALDCDDDAGRSPSTDTWVWNSWGLGCSNDSSLVLSEATWILGNLWPETLILICQLFHHHLDTLKHKHQNIFRNWETFQTQTSIFVATESENMLSKWEKRELYK